MSVDVSRGEYLWLLASQAKALYEATERNDADGFNQQFDLIETAMASANAVAASWGTPEEIFAPLQSVGIIGAGDMSVAFTRAVRAQQPSGARAAAAVDPPPVEPTLFSAMIAGVQSVASLTSTILALVRDVWKVTSLDVTVRGFVVNLSPRPLKYLIDDTGKNPYLKNCRSVSGPLGAVLPAAQQIADPQTRELRDCVAISPWTVTNDQSHTGAFAAVVADMGATDGYGNPYVGLGWGVPYSQGSRRTAIQPTQIPDAEGFFDWWDTGKQEPFYESNVGISNIFTQKSSLNSTDGRFLIMYRGIPL